MKQRLLFIVLSAMFCIGSAAQNNDVNGPESEIKNVIDDNNSAVSDSARSHRRFEEDDQEVQVQLADVNTLLDKIRELTINGGADEPSSSIRNLVPIKGKSKFTRRHYIYQTLDISPHVSTDRDSNLPEQTSNGKDLDESQLDSPTAFGLNFGYSLIMVPGREENDMLCLNKLGIAYNIGLLASFSRQDKYGTTCSFLAKLGFETGNGHAMGIGADFLGGYGKSNGDSYQLEYEDYERDDLADPYTAWCWQYGSQIWMRNNLLKTAMKNTEMLIFARFVRSIDPRKDSEMIKGYDYFWKEETWSFGIILRYTF